MGTEFLFRKMEVSKNHSNGKFNITYILSEFFNVESVVFISTIS